MTPNREADVIRIVDRFGCGNQNLAPLNGFIGLSICSHFFSRSRVRAIVEWSQRTFDRFLFLVTDDPQAYTFSATRGIPFEHALIRARRIGREKFDLVERASQDTDNRCRVVNWKWLKGHEQFAAILNSLQTAFHSHDVFRCDVLAQVGARGTAGGNRMESEPNPAAYYVLNELAAMLFLLEQATPKWSVQVFPLPMPLPLLGFYNGAYGIGHDLRVDRSGYVQIAVQ